MATSPLVPGRLPVAIEDHAYLMEPSGFRRETVQVLRQQADVSSEPGEASLNPQGLWRRSQESWHHGAGQDFLDGKSEEAADPHRFRSSKGIDPWTKGQISLHRPTIKAFSTTEENLFLATGLTSWATTAPILFAAAGNEVYQSAVPYNLINTVALQKGTGWTPTNATLAAEADFFKLTATSAAAVSAQSPTGVGGIPVEAGRRYGFALSTNYTSGGGGKVPRITITWYDAAGATISTSGPFAAAGNDGGVGGVTFIEDDVAPAGAAFAAITIGWTANWSNGEIHTILAVTFGPHDLVDALGSPDGWLAIGIQAGEAAQPIQSIVSNGSYLWAAVGTSGLHRHEVGTGFGACVANVPAAPASGQISLVGYANGFLLAAGSSGTSTSRRNTLWRVDNPTTTGSPLTEIKTHPNTNFVWEGISSGRSVVYAYGNSGNNGEIYKVPFDPSTGTLTLAASSASMLPEGETIHALYFYAGMVILGTGKGLRLGQVDGGGNIDYGPLVETDWPVRCLEPQGRYCWFGWSRYDDNTSGLGRADLGFMTDALTPAWASDLMTPGDTAGDVVAAVTFAPYGYLEDQRPPVRVFTVAGEGVYIEDPGSRVTSGEVLTGTIRFSTSEPKTTRSIDIRHHALPDGATVGVEMERESSGTWESIGLSDTDDSYGPASPLSLLNEEAEAMEFRLLLNRPTPDGEDFSRTPEVTRWTAKVLPTPSTIDETFTIPLLMRSSVKDMNGSAYTIDVAAEVAYLKGLERDRTLVNLQLGDEEHTVYISASQFEGQNWSDDRGELEGVLTIQAMTVRG